MILVDKTSPVPLYVQIEDVIRANINSGVWQSSKQIPSENDLVAEFGVSRMTIRGVLNSLVDEGLLYRVPGKGTFVSEKTILAHALAYKGIREQLEDQGLATETELLDAHRTRVSESVRNHLNLGPNDLVIELLRRRLVEGVPVSLHRSYIPADLAPDLDSLDLVSEQLCVILSRNYNLNPGKTVEQLFSSAAKEDEAQALEIPRGAPILVLEDTISNARGTTFEYSKICFRGNRFKLRFEY